MALVACSPPRGHVEAAAVADGPAAPAAPSGASPSDRPIGALAADVERRGWRTLGELPAARSGNVVVAPFGVGLTSLAAEALLGRAPSALRPYAGLTHTTAACFGAVNVAHRFAFAPDVAVSEEGARIAWALSPGRHDGEPGEPSAALRCAPVYRPPDRVPAPSARDLTSGGEPAPRVSLERGATLGRSRTAAYAWFARCRDVTVSFASCGADAGSTLADALTAPKESPPGIELSTIAAVEETSDGVLVAMPTVARHLREGERRAQSFVVLVPRDACSATSRVPGEALAERMRAAARTPRTIEVRLTLPVIETRTDVVAAVPAPLDGLVASAATYTPPCGAFAPSPAARGARRIVVDRPFAYAFVDDATGAVLALGRFDELALREPRAPERGPTPGGASGLSP